MHLIYLNCFCVRLIISKKSSDLFLRILEAFSCLRDASVRNKRTTIWPIGVVFNQQNVLKNHYMHTRRIDFTVFGKKHWRLVAGHRRTSLERVGLDSVIPEHLVRHTRHCRRRMGADDVEKVSIQLPIC